MRKISLIFFASGTVIFLLPAGLAAYVYVRLAVEGASASGMVSVLMALAGYYLMTIFNCLGAGLLFLSYRRSPDAIQRIERYIIFVAMACQFSPLVAVGVRQIT